MLLYIAIFSLILRQYLYIGSLDITIPRYNVDLIPLPLCISLISGFPCVCSSLLFCRNLHFWDGAEIHHNSFIFQSVEQIRHIFEVHFQLNDVTLKINNATYGMFFKVVMQYLKRIVPGDVPKSDLFVEL